MEHTMERRTLTVLFVYFRQVPKTVMEDREIEVPRQVYETVTKTVQRPKTIMEEKVVTVQEPKITQVARQVPSYQTVYSQPSTATFQPSYMPTTSYIQPSTVASYVAPAQTSANLVTGTPTPGTAV